MPKVPYPYEVNDQLVTGNGSYQFVPYQTVLYCQVWLYKEKYGSAISDPA